MHISELETPALLIDIEIMERNLRRAADYAREHDLRMRPHIKTHKIPELGRRQLDLGAVGLAVAKVGEAEVMLGANPPELLVAYPVIGRKKLARLMEVARKTRVTVALDSLFAARQLSDAARETRATIGVLAEFDAGLGRTGVRPGEELIQLAQGILRLPRLTFEGVAFYPGHIRQLNEEGLKAMSQLALLLRQVLGDFKKADIEVKIVSGGSTPTLFYTHQLPGVNEIRPGSYIFNDRSTFMAGTCKLEDCAASILTTVVSTAKPGQAIIDGGSKTFSSDRLRAAAEPSFGYVVDAPGTQFFTMNEEHGYLDIRKAGREFTVGDALRIIPNHICVAMNLHERVYGVCGDKVERTWVVEARGKLQ
jgi:D-serine deaminase-like pyridoxal phosphate-dependent protein